jgi:hypothetical protein
MPSEIGERQSIIGGRRERYRIVDSFGEKDSMTREAIVAGDVTRAIVSVGGIPKGPGDPFRNGGDGMARSRVGETASLFE